MTFDKVMSLGPSCETAWQIRQIVDQPEAYVFDWVIAAPASVARAISNDFSEIVQAGQLSLRNLDNGDHPYVLDAATGIEYHHDFRNDTDFLATLPDVQSKYNFLIDRMRSVLSSNTQVLFVHQLGTLDDAKLLETAIAGRFVNLRFKLLEISFGGPPAPPIEEGRLILANIDGAGSTWQERAPAWKRLLEDLLLDSLGRTLRRVTPAVGNPI